MLKTVRYELDNTIVKNIELEKELNALRYIL